MCASVSAATAAPAESPDGSSGRSRQARRGTHPCRTGSSTRNRSPGLQGCEWIGTGVRQQGEAAKNGSEAPTSTRRCFPWWQCGGIGEAWT